MVPDPVGMVDFGYVAYSAVVVYYHCFKLVCFWRSAIFVFLNILSLGGLDIICWVIFVFHRCFGRYPPLFIVLTIVFNGFIDLFVELTEFS